MSTPLTNNTERIRELIQQIENLPNAGSGGIDLPTLDNPGAAEHLLQDKELINEVGVKVVGTMSNNGEVSRTMDGVNTKSVSIPAGYTSGGTVSLDDTIDNAVSDALAALAEKGVTVPAGTKVDGLADLIAAIEAGGGGTSDMEAQWIAAIERKSDAVVTSLPAGITSIGDNVFYSYFDLALTSLPAGLTSIGGYAFYQCTNLALTSLPAGLTSIGGYAFYKCSSLALTSLPAGLTSIGEFAFYGCSSLALTSLPAGLTSIGNYAFRDCTSLTQITFEGKPNSIASKAFAYADDLTTINVPWAEGEVANAPWGATNATINYNYTGG